MLEKRREKNELLKIKNHNIKLFVTDVDGVLTDSGMYYSTSGEEFKKFNTRDGKGFELLKLHGIKTAIITSENNSIIEKRAQKMKIDFVFCGVNDKVEIIKNLCETLKISIDDVLFIGDDVNDTELLRIVGFSACPADAITENKQIVNYICSQNGGDGCIREICDKILQK